MGASETGGEPQLTGSEDKEAFYRYLFWARYVRCCMCCGPVRLCLHAHALFRRSTFSIQLVLAPLRPVWKLGLYRRNNYTRPSPAAVNADRSLWIPRR
jgi:hypothetical protein